MTFAHIKSAVAAQIASMESKPMFRVDIDGDALWQTYLNSFRPEDNPTYRERTEHDCSCCRHFVKNYGGLITINDDGSRSSIWDVDVSGTAYAPVVAALSEIVNHAPIADLFLTDTQQLGTDRNHEALETGQIKTWEHFYAALTSDKHLCQRYNIPTQLGRFRSSAGVTLRGLNEITRDAVATVLDLIAQGSLYRGDEHIAALSKFSAAKVDFDRLTALTTEQHHNDVVWRNVATGTFAPIRNTVIGSLLVDLSEGVDLERAVKAFEDKVAPTNYKRPKALITPAMVKKAQETVEALGIEDSLSRRHAVLSDITINNVLWANKGVKKALNVFDEITQEAAAKPGRLDKVEEMPATRFIHEVLPNVSELSLLVEHELTGNFVSLIAPVHADAPNILKWGNNFSWSYIGEVTDSIKSKVKRAGGDVTGDLRVSLAWSNGDDLDLHCMEPSRNRIYFGNKRSSTGGELDVDMNAGGPTNSTDPVENITFPARRRMAEGVYRFEVNNYSQRSTSDVGFTIEVEHDGTVYSFAHPAALGNGRTVGCVDVTLKNGEFSVKGLIESGGVDGREVWGVKTGEFVPVNAVMQSPNFWDGQSVGNAHTFFMLEGCKADTARGFYNEYLKAELNDHRKVFEVLGGKMRVEPTDEQISGLGFSSTQRANAYLKLSGSFNRTIKIIF